MGGNRCFILHPFRSLYQTASCFDKQNSSHGIEAAGLKYPFPGCVVLSIALPIQTVKGQVVFFTSEKSPPSTLDGLDFCHTISPPTRGTGLHPFLTVNRFILWQNRLRCFGQRVT